MRDTCGAQLFQSSFSRCDCTSIWLLPEVVRPRSHQVSSCPGTSSGSLGASAEERLRTFYLKCPVEATGPTQRQPFTFPEPPPRARPAAPLPKAETSSGCPSRGPPRAPALARGSWGFRPEGLRDGRRMQSALCVLQWSRWHGGTASRSHHSQWLLSSSYEPSH